MSFEQLTVLNLEPGSTFSDAFPRSIIIETCQRTIVAGISTSYKHDKNHETYTGTSAYQFLLEVICGLKSKIIAEHEIVSQFKNAYHHYLRQPQESKDGNLIKLIEKLFKDSKEIRTKYLLGLSHESYAGIAKKICNQSFHIKNGKTKSNLTILGSGKLAEDIIKNCAKSYNIHVVARNAEKLESLKNLYQVSTSLLSADIHFHDHAFIINTIGTKEVLFNDDNFFNEWKEINTERFFLDLGAPSAVSTKLKMDQSVVLLGDFFEFAEKMNLEKRRKIGLAKIAIEAIVKKRELLISKRWNELSYQMPEWRGIVTV